MWRILLFYVLSFVSINVTITIVFCNRIIMTSLALKYRAYPTKEQQQLFAHTFGCVRFVFNQLLDYRHKEYYTNNNSINYTQTAKKLTEMKLGIEWLKNVSSVALQQSLRNLDSAYGNFFKGRSSYPKFKSKHNKQSFRLVNSGFRLKNGEIYIAKSNEPLKIKLSRPIDLTKVNSITISKDCSGRYFVSIQGEKEIKELPKNDHKIGIDLGLTHLAITSDGVKFNNKRHTKKYEVKLAMYQKRLSKKQKGSNNRYKARLKVAKIHAKIADCRKDYLHKLSTKLINENQVICLEDLAIKNMVKNRKLSKAISDVSWGEFVSLLTYKAGWYGRNLVKIDRWFPSSKTCSECGHLHSKMPLSIRKFSCDGCGVKLDRDINAARNILAAGHVVLACGAGSLDTTMKQEPLGIREVVPA